jgi:hypothetical protein
MNPLLKYGLILLICATTTALVWAVGERPSQAIRIQTESKEEINKILASLEGVDKSTYRLTVVETQPNGKSKTRTHGAVPIDVVRKLGGGKLVAAGPGITRASDVIIIIKNVTNSAVAQDKVLRSLDTKLSRIDRVDASKLELGKN